MNFEYIFLLKSNVNLDEGDWEPLSFERNGFHVRIRKPEPETNYYIKIRPGNGPAIFDVSRLRPGSALALKETMVCIEMKSEVEIPKDKIIQTLHPIAIAVFRDFKSWLRVLTRQYWIGYQNSPFAQQDFHVNAITGKLKKPMSVAGEYRGFDYWKTLDQKVWSVLGKKLAERSLPSPGQLFFCDGLDALGSCDLAQAVVALGVACELELYLTITDIVESGKSTPQKLDRIDWLKFERKLRLLGSFNKKHFKYFDAKAARLVNKLYAMRGAAIHRANLRFVDSSKSVLWNASQLICFVHAAEKLFEWLDIQRTALAR